MEILFLSLLLFAGYSYLIYPAVLFVLATFVRTPWLQEKIEPPVSIIISAYNEESVIGQKIRNTLALDYPEGQLEIIVSSDGSTDKTNEIVSGFEDSRLVLRAFSERSGKTACLNRVVPDAKGDIVLFTDANAMFPSDLLAKLIRNFASPEIGLVTGWTRYTDPDGGEKTTGLYSRFEGWTKKCESLISSCVGADGAVFAIRKSLYQRLEDYDINDFIIPLNIIKQGKRVVLDPDVFCFEQDSKAVGKGYRRQVRITTRTLGAIRRNAEFFNPFQFRFFSFFFLSHKAMRFLEPLFFLSILVTNIFILGEHPIYVAILICQIVFLGVGIFSILGKLDGRIATLCRLLIVTFYAQLVGWIRMIRGAEDTLWTPEREA